MGGFRGLEAWEVLGGVGVGGVGALRVRENKANDLTKFELRILTRGNPGTQRSAYPGFFCYYYFSGWLSKLTFPCFLITNTAVLIINVLV